MRTRVCRCLCLRPWVLVLPLPWWVPALALPLALLGGLGYPASARPVDETNALQHFMQLEEAGQGPSAPASGVFGAAQAGTTWFGGTVYDAVDARWEAMVGGTWTFDSGVGSSFSPTVDGGKNIPGLNPFKDPALHTSMEGWVGFDNTFGLQTQFRRLDASAGWAEKGKGPSVVNCVGAPYIPGGGSYSFYAGLLPSEGYAVCYQDSGGYGNAWNLCIELTSLSVDGTAGPVSWTYAWKGDSEPGFDYSYAIVDTNGTGLGGEVTVAQYTGTTGGTAGLSLTPGAKMRRSAGAIWFKFCFAADGAYSDEDGNYPTTCGAFTVDNVSIRGRGLAYGPEGFETGDGGWALSPPQPGSGGEWSDIVSVADLPPTKTACPCLLADSVLVFIDNAINGHGRFQDNLAGSPVIDLAAAGVSDAPGKVVHYEAYVELPLLNYIFVQTNVKWYPARCPVTGGIIESPWTSDGFVNYYGSYPPCRDKQNPAQFEFSSIVDVGATRMQIAVGMLSYCRFYTNCTGITNTTPWFDNVRLGVYATPGAPFIAARTIDMAQDAFPVANSLDPSNPGRFDNGAVKGSAVPEPGTALGDTLVVQGGGLNPLTQPCTPATCGTEVQVVFHVCPGPANGAAVAAWLSTFPTIPVSGALRTAIAPTWYYARMDTAEQGGTQSATSRAWMTAFHESDPHFTGTDTQRSGDLDPRGKPRLLNDIFPDNLFTPGTRVTYFYRARYLNGPSWFGLPVQGDLFTFGLNEGTDYFEWECLPSSMEVGPDTTWNCTLYVDHFDGRGAQLLIEPALGGPGGPLVGGSGNCENVRWDRYDVEAPSSQQASLGRPTNTQFGATVIHLLAYEGILWNSGNLSAFTLVKEDADQLDPWLTLGATLGIDTDNKFYGTGDGLAESITQEAASEPSALVFLNQLCGTALRCKTYRDEGCGPAVGQIPGPDLTACVDIDPVGVGTPASPRAANTVVGAGNGCPQLRSFDVLNVVASTRYGAVVAADETYNTVANPALDDYASIAVAQDVPANGATYRTVIDGISIHYRADKADCRGAAPIQGRLNEVLTWLGLSGLTGCDNPAKTVDVPAGHLRAHQTALANIVPNPLSAGAAGSISFTMAYEGRAVVDILDVSGRRVRTVLDAMTPAGPGTTTWDGTDAQGRRLASGVYFVRFQAEGREITRKVVLLRN